MLLQFVEPALGRQRLRFGPPVLQFPEPALRFNVSALQFVSLVLGLLSKLVRYHEHLIHERIICV